MKKTFMSAFATLVLAACTPQNNPASTAASAEAVAETSGNGDALNVADAAIQGGDPSMALSVSQSVLSNDPQNTDALIHEGDAYYALQRCPDAVAAYSLALKINPRSSAAETGVGRCLLRTDPHGAEAALSLAVQDNPSNAAAWDDLGIARDLQGNFSGALAPYQQALLAQPGSVPTEENLGLSLALSGNATQALQYLGPLAAGPDATPKIRQNYAVALIASGRGEEARQVLAIDLPPDQVDAAMQGLVQMFAAAQPPLTSSPMADAAPEAPVSTTSLPEPATP